jgi:DNA-binding winged helix-turn-helix (wHTH) protein/class 3 adenylate cyclase/tetratricopeptide (TPR) repeat protein
MSMLFHFGDFTLDAEAYELRRQGERIALEPKGVQVLHYLIQQRDRVVPHDELFAQCWPGTFVSDWALTRCLARIRKALGDGRDGTRMITTVRGQGYRFVAPLTEVPRTATPSAGAAQEPLPPAPGSLPPPLSPPLSGAPDGLDAPHSPPPRPAGAERRVLTVLCCALVDARASHRDPEEVQAVVQDYHRLCTDVVQGLEGTIAHYLPNEVIAYFGYPQAHEDDARRGTRAGLQLVTAFGAQWAGVTDPAWAVRIGVHTGLVVVGESAGNRPGPLAVGETLALAARLQDGAAPGTVVISAATARLVEGYFAWQETASLPHAVDATTPMAYQVLREHEVQSRLEVATKRGLTPFIGRDAELSVLHTRWAEVTAGLGQVVVLTGEPGIGKSRLVQTLTAHLAAAPHGLLEWRCSPYHHHSPWYPVIAQLHRWLQWRPDEPPEAKLQRLEAVLAAVGLPVPDAVPLLAALLGLPLPATYPPLTLSPPRQKQRTLDLLLAWLLAEAAQHPVLLIVEDLHWSDPSTLELLTLLIDHGPTARLLTLLTSRPEFQSPWTPRAHVTYLPLGRLPRRQVEEMVVQVSGGKALPPTVVDDITAKTDGVPLFVEELTAMVLESGLLQAEEGNYTLTGPLPPLAIPTTLHGVLMARLDRLQPAKTVAQLGATIGRTFAYDVLQAIAPLDEASIQQGLRQLVEAELVYQQGGFPQATYTFKHALIQDAAYHSLLKNTRQQVHQRIAQVLESQFFETVETQPELLAHHTLCGEVWEKAVAYCRQVGEKALARSAYREAVGYLEQALSILPHLPETRDTQEQAIDLRLALRNALHPSGDYRRILTLLREAEILVEALNDPRRLGQISGSLSNYFYNMGAYDQAIAAGQRTLALATASGEVVQQALANHHLTLVYYNQGNYRRAIDGYRQTVVTLDRAPRHERFGQVLLPALAYRARLAACHAELGTFAEGRTLGEEGLRIAQAVDHPVSLLYALWGIGLLSLRQGDLQRALALLQRAMSIGQDVDLPLYLPWVAAALGEAYTLSERSAEAVRLLTQVMEQTTVMNMVFCQVRCRLPLGKAQLLAGHFEKAQILTERTLALARERQEHGSVAYALHLLGEITARRESQAVDLAAAHYYQALVLAEELGMRPLQAHCHHDLGLLYAATGQGEQARAALSRSLAMYQALAMTFWVPQAEAALAQVAG